MLFTKYHSCNQIQHPFRSSLLCFDFKITLSDLILSIFCTVKQGYSIYSKNCTIIRCNNVKLYDIPPTCFCLIGRLQGGTKVNQKVKAVFKLRGNRDREELVHCALLTMLVEEFSHLQYSALPSVEWQQRGRKHGRSFARLLHRRTTWRSAVSLGRRSETCGNSPSYVGWVWTEHHESTKGLWVGGKV